MAYVFLVSCLTIILCGLSCWGLPSTATYWEELLPNTVMPAAIHTSLSTHNNNTTRVINWESSDEVVMQGYDSLEHCKVDPSAEVSASLKSRFVLVEDLRVGSQITVQLKPIAAITTQFPASMEDLPPFTTEHLEQNLQHFNVSSDSKAAFVMNLTLHKCEERKPINGKWQYCSTSLKDLLEYVNATLGLKGLHAVSPPSATAEGLAGYRVASVKPLAAGNKLTICHRFGFPYAVFYCHQPAATKALSVLLSRQNDGHELDTIVVCHQETSTWAQDYIEFKALGVHPGTPICHFIHSNDLIWYRM